MEKGFSIDTLTFMFPQQKKPFFEALSLDWSSGKLHFIQGKNGSGKSTLLRILQGRLLPGEQLTGMMMLNSHKVRIEHTKVPSWLTNQIKTVVQDTDTMLADQFTVEQNLQCAQVPRYPGLSPLPPLQELPLLLEEFGIQKDTQVNRLSGGQRQILAIMMVLQKPTSVLLLDEPTAALDPQNASMIMNFLQKLASTQQLTVLIISHDKELVKAYCSGACIELYQKDTGDRGIRKSSLSFL